MGLFSKKKRRYTCPICGAEIEGGGMDNGKRVLITFARRVFLVALLACLGCLAQSSSSDSEDVMRALEGPLADVHDDSLRLLTYPGPASSLTDVWKAVRSSLRSVE